MIQINNEQVKAIDVYRGMLAQYVIIAHVIPSLFGGVMGVPGTLAVWGFFVTSGYLNGLSLQRNPQALSYFKRRFIRLYPLLFLSFAVVALFLKSIFISDFYTLAPFIFWTKADMPNNGVLWTLIVELQLYILSPFVYALLAKSKIPDAMIKWSVFVLPLISIFMSAVASEIAIGTLDLDDRTVLSAFPMYFFGMLIAVKGIDAFKDFFGHYVFAIASMVLFVVVVYFRNAGEGAWSHLSIEGRFIPFFLTAYVLSRYRGFSVFRDNGIFSKLGKLTYEIYLFHGLFAFILYQILPEHGAVLIVLFFWVLPVFAAFSYDYLRKKTQLQGSIVMQSLMSKRKI